MANLIGSTYHFSGSTTGNTQISAAAGTNTDPANPGFCVGPPVACGSGSGMSGSYTFQDINPGLSTINFVFFGSTAGAGPGTFSIDLGNFILTDTDHITGVTYASGNLVFGDFTSVSWDGTDAVFTGSTSTDYNAIGGATVVFDVAETAPVPEPSSILLFAAGLGGIAAGVKKLRRA